MSDIAIRCEGLSKQYRIGEQERYKALRDVITDAAASPFRRLRSAFDRRRQTVDENGSEASLAPNGRPSSVVSQPSAGGNGSSIRNPKSEIPNCIWALDDVSFEVKRGEVVGIIGRNGAGKSTLLKILSRITKPTRGSAQINGRIGSLLEVGTGFHPELTGRENIYLNGAILGMRKAEIERKFDNIVAFAEVEKFIDTPVKRYSSGMYVRLAFGVAAYLEPDILLVDEVLAVGDAAFQKKCLGKMDDVAKQGRTVLFVSHNMQMIDLLCPRSVLLQGGRVAMQGKTGDVLARYHESLREIRVDGKTALHDNRVRRGNGAARFTDIVVQDTFEENRYRYATGETVRFKLTYEITGKVDGLQIGVMFRSGTTGEPLTIVMHPVTDGIIDEYQSRTVVIEMPNLNLLPGTYPIYFWLGDEHGGRSYDTVDDLTPPLVVFSDREIQSTGFFHTESSFKFLE